MKSDNVGKISLAAMAAAMIFSGCNGGHGSGSVSGTPSSTQVCSTIKGCATTAAGFQFPDGSGGEVVCTNGTCVDQNNGLSTNYSAGYTAGYSQGYNDGTGVSTAAAYNNGYNSGYNDGQNAGFNGGYNSGYNAGYNAGYNDGYSTGYSNGVSGFSVADQTKDVDLQKANVQQLDANTRAQNIANQFQMSFDKALELTQLSDKVRKMTVQGQMTSEDRAAIANSALAIAGVTPEDIGDALSREGKGDSGGTEALLTKAAANLGMPSAAALRDQLLPALGVQF